MPPLEWVGASSRRGAVETIAVPCLVLAFEFDIDSPPGRAAEAAAAMPGARCLPRGGGHLGPLTTPAEVADLLVRVLVLACALTTSPPSGRRHRAGHEPGIDRFVRLAGEVDGRSTAEHLDRLLGRE